MSVLAEMLADPQQIETALQALRATEDKAILPILLALCRSEAADRRRFAVVALAEMFEVQAAAALVERMTADPDRGIRIEAAARLMFLDALEADRLLEATRAPDEEIRCMAADAMVRKGRGMEVVELLEQLAMSRDPRTSSSARLNLVSLGRRQHLDELRRIVRDPGSSERLLVQILAQIQEEKIAPAADLARELAGSDRSSELRVRAYLALCTTADDGPATLRKAIEGSPRMVFNVNLLSVLAGQPGAKPQLQMLANGEGVTATLARFELARTDGGPAAAAAAERVAAMGHPVVIGYLLDRAEEDVKNRGDEAAFHVQALLRVIRAADPEAAVMGAEHYRAARATTILVNMAAPEGVGALKEILAGRYGAVVRAVAAGLMRARNPIARELARPLLKSPYDELVSDAALVLGSFGDADAAMVLERFIVDRGRASTPLVALSSWYLLKIAGRTEISAEQLASCVR